MTKNTKYSRDSIDQHLSWLTSRGRSENTIRAYRADLNGLLQYAGPFPLTEFESRAAHYLTAIKPDVSPKTLNRKLGTFRGFGQRNGFPECLEGYRGPTPPRAIPNPIKGGVESMVKLYEEACKDNKQLGALVALCGFQGLRIHEALGVTVHDFDFENRTLTVHGKGDKTRVIPVFDKPFQMLVGAYVEAVNGDGRLINYSNRGARKAIKRIGQRAGLGDISSHQLRSTFGTEGYRKTKDLRMVQDLLGHASSQTTEVYTHVDMDSMRGGDILA